VNTWIDETGGREDDSLDVPTHGRLAGGISWATIVGLSAYFIGHSTSGVFMVFGLVGLSAALLVGGLLLRRTYRAHQAPSAFAEPLS
jgi:hypothetical protein